MLQQQLRAEAVQQHLESQTERWCYSNLLRVLSRQVCVSISIGFWLACLVLLSTHGCGFPFAFAGVDLYAEWGAGDGI